MLKKILVLLVTVTIAEGCSLRQAGYSVVGAGAGGTIGYSIHHDKKEAAIGALGGAMVGNITAQIQDSSNKKKRKKDYDEGYTQSQLDTANKNWEAGTGQYSQNNNATSKRLVRFKVPKREENGVIYDEHYVTLEDHQ